MADEKKKYNPLTDLAAPLRGVKNVLTGRIFDGESWDDEKDFLREQNAGKGEVKTDGNGDEEVEETTTRTVRRGKRGTFVSTPAKSGGNAGSGGSGEAQKGAPAGEQNKEEGK